MEKELPYFNEQLSRILNFYFSVYGKKMQYHTSTVKCHFSSKCSIEKLSFLPLFPVSNQALPLRSVDIIA